MKSFKSALKDLVGNIIWCIKRDLSNSGLQICYGPEKYIIKVCELLEICEDNDTQLSVKGLLSVCGQYSDFPNINVIGKIRLVDSIHNEIGFFNLKKGSDNKILFSENFYNNLLLIDVGMPKLLEQIVTTAKSKKITKVSEICENILITNPLDVDKDWIKYTYIFKIGRLLYNFALGMNEESIWNGVTPTGGIIFIENEAYNGFNYFDQTTIGKYLIDSTELVIDGTFNLFKLSKCSI